MSDLEPLSPEEAVSMYEDHRRGEITDETLDGQIRELQRVIEWCDEHGIENLNTLSGRNLHEYRLWRKQRNGGIAQSTLQNVLTMFNRFLRFCQSIDGVTQGLHEKLIVPDRPDGATREEMLEAEQARDVLDYLEQFQYGSRDHAVFATLWLTGMRVGAAHSLDTDDVHLDAENPHIEIRHRPQRGTRLKNGEDGERLVYTQERLLEALHAYMQHTRRDREDEHGRSPLFTTAQGRASKETLSRVAYKWTQPCAINGGCPHDKNPNSCEWAVNKTKARKCPSTVGPHPFRRGAITHLLTVGTPQDVVSDRVDVTPDILEAHYDERDETERLEARRSFLEDVE